MMELFFRRPGELVLGRESADQALARFDEAVGRVVAGRPDGGNVAVVSHGTVIALFVARHGGRGGRGFDLWRRLGLPSFVVMGAPGYGVEAVVDSVAG